MGESGSLDELKGRFLPEKGVSISSMALPGGFGLQKEPRLKSAGPPAALCVGGQNTTAGGHSRAAFHRDRNVRVTAAAVTSAMPRNRALQTKLAKDKVFINTIEKVEIQNLLNLESNR